MRDENSACVKKIPFTYIGVKKNRHSSAGLFTQRPKILTKTLCRWPKPAPAAFTPILPRNITHTSL